MRSLSATTFSVCSDTSSRTTPISRNLRMSSSSYRLFFLLHFVHPRLPVTFEEGRQGPPKFLKLMAELGYEIFVLREEFFPLFVNFLDFFRRVPAKWYIKIEVTASVTKLERFESLETNDLFNNLDRMSADDAG